MTFSFSTSQYTNKHQEIEAAAARETVSLNEIVHTNSHYLFNLNAAGKI